MVAHPPKAALYEQVARVGKALGAPRRLEILDLLGQAPRTVEALATASGMSVANTSQHLQILRVAGLVASSRDGLFVTYRLASDDVAEFSTTLRRLAESHLADLERLKARFFTSADDLDALTSKQLLARVQRGEVVLLDVRPAEEYAAAHIHGAVSIPHDELERRIGELSKHRRVVAYCRGPYCVFAADAVKLLRRRGFKAKRIEDGVVEWRARGLPVVAARPEVRP
jgi:rhodanese-related sulfurtransferase/DNA-binding transcriptional ArsR family regulator